MTPKIAFIFTHRIQYFTNLMDELDRRGRVRVAAFYAHETARISDPGFARSIVWNNRTNTRYAETILPDSAARSFGAFLHSLSRELAPALARFGPDVVHLNGYNAALQWQALFWANRRKLPVFARGDGDTLGGPQRSPLAPQTVLAKLFARRVTHVFHQGIENEKFWLARGVSPVRLSWAPCVSDGQVFRVAAFADPAARDAFRAAQGIRSEDVVFVVSGKLETRKRPADVIDALTRCTSERARLWFLGSGPLEADLKALAQERGVGEKITWLGFRNQTELPAVLQAADVLVHPSEKDPWPYSILEGAISGLALLLSDHVGSYPDLVTKAGAGEVFPVANVRELAGKMSRLAADDDTRRNYQQAARVEAARYTESGFCERFEATVQQLAL